MSLMTGRVQLAKFSKMQAAKGRTGCHRHIRGLSVGEERDVQLKHNAGTTTGYRLHINASRQWEEAESSNTRVRKKENSSNFQIIKP